MPPKYVQTVRQLIYWHYAHLIARAAGFEGNYGFIVSRYKKLDSGEMSWSSSVRDYQKELDRGKECIYCGETSRLSTDHIIPISRAGVDPRIAMLLDTADNCVCACQSCNSSKGDRDKFLKLAYRLHETQGTLDLKDPNMDGVLDIYDLGVVLTNLISKISDQVSKDGTPPPKRD
jgi:hypothetical protein